MVLVDTSVWIDYFRGKDLPHVRRLTELIERGEDLCICGIVEAEVLQGIREDKAYREVATYLGDLINLELPRNTYLAAARICRFLRAKGVTIRNAVDCLIAAACIEHGAALLHNDRDFEGIARHFPLGTS